MPAVAGAHYAGSGRAKHLLLFIHVFCCLFQVARVGITFLHDWGKPSHYYITQSASPVVYSSGWACSSHAHYVTQCKNVTPTLGHSYPCEVCINYIY